MSKSDKKSQAKSSVKKYKKAESEEEPDIEITKKLPKKSVKKAPKKSSSESSSEESIDMRKIKKTIKTPTKTKSKRHIKTVEQVKPSITSEQLSDRKRDCEDKNKCLYVKTTQTSAIKQMFERTSHVITECKINFIAPEKVVDKEMEVDSPDDGDDYYQEHDENADTNPQANQPKKKKIGGISIMSLTEDCNIILKIHLEADQFVYFRCDQPMFSIGVDMVNLYTFIKGISDDTPIVFYMNRNNRNVLYIKSMTDNSESTRIEINLLEINVQDIPILKTNIRNIITVASDKFHEICKVINNVSQFVEIRSVDNNITFKGTGDGGNIERSYEDENSKRKPTGDVIQGIYELRNLMGFSKCNKLCNSITIYLKNNYPLVLAFSVATLGKMYVFLSPVQDVNN